MNELIHWLDAHNPAVTALATILIAVFTIVLTFVTGGQALQTRKALNLTRRPKLRVRLTRPLFTDGAIKIAYTLINVGDKPAILKRHEITLYMQPNATDAEIKVIAENLSLPCPHLQGGESRDMSTTIGAQNDLGWSIANNNSVLRGILEYEDEFGIMRRTGFSRTWDVKLRRFRKGDDIEEEYED